jgi:hypothetical protein
MQVLIDRIQAASHGDPTSRKIIHRSLTLYKITQKFVQRSTQFIRDNIEVELNSDLRAHQRMYDETKRKLTFILGGSLLDAVLGKKPSLLHYDSICLFEALSIVTEHHDFFYSLSDSEQRNLLARLAVRPWSVDDVKELQAVPPIDIKKYLGDVLRRSLRARQLLPVTANGLCDAGFNPSILHGNAGADRAQETLLATANALSDAGVNPSILRGPTGSARGQRMLLSTIRSMENAGYGILPLHGAAGSARAGEKIVETSDALVAKGYDAAMLTRGLLDQPKLRVFLLILFHALNNAASPKYRYAIY